MSICNSTASMTGEHRFEWRATFDGGGYWICMNSNCGEVSDGFTDHNGG